MNYKLLTAVLLVATLAACDRQVPPAATEDASGHPESAQTAPLERASGKRKTNAVLAGGVLPTFQFSISSSKSVENGDGSVSKVQRVIFKKVRAEKAAADLKVGYRKLGYQVADAGIRGDEASYVARKGEQRIRFVVVPDHPDAAGAAATTGMVTFFWREQNAE